MVCFLLLEEHKSYYFIYISLNDMKSIKHLSLALLIAALVPCMPAQAQTTTHSATPWVGKTYNWVDEAGQPHTSLLTDKATDPRQIMALLNAVYTDPEIPGQTKHNEYLANGTYCKYQIYERNINYDDHAHWIYHYNIGPLENDRPRQGRGSYDVSEYTILSNLDKYFKLNGFEWESEEQKQEANLYHATKKNTDLFTSREWAYIDWIGERTEPVPNPVDGMTVLLVEVKDTWKQSDHTVALERGDYTLPYIEKAIKSVQLMTQWIHVSDEVNPGYIFLADEVTTDRFFFLSKGRTRRQDTRRAPFAVAFEIVSPRETQLQAENLNNGQVERVQHDCYSVFQQGGTPHYVELDDGEASTLSKLTLFMPDKRFRGVEYDPVTNTLNTDGWSGWYNSHNPEFLYQDPTNFAPDMTDADKERYQNRFKPGMLLYKAFLTAEATPSEKESDASSPYGYYDIKLDWKTWFDAAKLYTDVAEQYYVYILKPDGSWQLLKEVEAAAQAGMGETTRDRTFKYPWPVREQAQTFTYMITANPIDIDGDNTTISNILVNSNTATVIIPGRTEFIVNASDYRSRFALDDDNKELNVYRNRPEVILNSNDIHVAHGNNTQHYSLHRIALGENGTETSDTEIATITFTGNNHASQYDYTVSYMNQNLDILFDEETSKATSQNGTIKVGESIKTEDRFYASTKENAHPAGYIYVMKFKDNNSEESNRYTVPVFKSSCEAHFAGFTQEQVDADVDHRLIERHQVGIDFTIADDKERVIERYDVHRINNEDPDMKDYHARIGKAEVTNDNKLVLVGINHETGTLNVDPRSFDHLESQNTKMRFYDDSRYCPFDYPEYVTEIFAGTRDWAGNHTINTYGTNTARVGVPQLHFWLEQKPIISKQQWNTPDGPVMGFAAILSLEPDLTADENIKNVYYYRIWRVMDDGTEVLLNTLESKNEQNAANWDYMSEVSSYSGIKDYWKSNTATVRVIDNYLSSAIPDVIVVTQNEDGTETTTTKTGKKEVKYIARMYSTRANKPQEEETPQELGKFIEPHEDDVNSIFYVTEKELDVTYDYSDNVFTAIGSVMENSPVVSTRYYNLQGQSSDRLMEGVNIEVSVHADGTVTSRKVIFRR